MIIRNMTINDIVECKLREIQEINVDVFNDYKIAFHLYKIRF